MNDSLTQNSQQNFNRSHFKCRKKNSSLVIERMPQSLTPGVISVCFLPGSEDRTPGGSAVTNLDNLKSLMVLLLPQRHVSIFPQCHK